MVSSAKNAESIWLKMSSSVKCFRKIAFVGHFALQSPSPLQRMGLTQAFLPCGVLRKSMAPYVQTVIHAPQDTQSFSFTSQIDPETVTVSFDKSVKALLAAP